MDSKAFRQAVATLIDKEFITDVIFTQLKLEGRALSMYTVVPQGNVLWWNPDVQKFGKDRRRPQRINEAVNLLKGAGFTWDKEPKVEGERVQEPGEGLRTPDGQLVLELELLPPGEGFDFMRTAAEWIETWLNEAGIPVKANLTDQGGLGARLGDSSFDMFILGVQLDPIPVYLSDFFHSQGPFNLGGYSNSKLDATADEFVAETGLDAAQAKAFELQALLAEELPWVPLFNKHIQEAYLGEVVDWAFIEVLNGVQAYFENIVGPLSYTTIN